MVYGGGMTKRRIRPQTVKPYTPRADVQRIQELRRGNSTAPIPSGKAYKRPKAGGRNREW